MANSLLVSHKRYGCTYSIYNGKLSAVLNTIRIGQFLWRWTSYSMMVLRGNWIIFAGAIHVSVATCQYHCRPANRSKIIIATLRVQFFRVKSGLKLSSSTPDMTAIKTEFDQVLLKDLKKKYLYLSTTKWSIDRLSRDLRCYWSCIIQCRSS